MLNVTIVIKCVFCLPTLRDAVVGSLVKECDTVNMSETKLPLVSPPAVSPVISAGESTQKAESMVASALDIGDVTLNLTDSVTSLRASEVRVTTRLYTL